jgi:hypothetical protein
MERAGLSDMAGYAARVAVSERAASEDKVERRKDGERRSKLEARIGGGSRPLFRHKVVTLLRTKFFREFPSAPSPLGVSAKRAPPDPLPAG